jgi:hypothetical protein
MSRGGNRLLATGMLAAAFAVGPGLGASAGADAGIPNGTEAFARRVVTPVDHRALAAEIDRALAARWAEMGVTPAPAADDAEFLRRACLDLAGRTPPASEARAFLDSDDPDKRAKLVERLLAGPAYVNQMTDVWKELLLPEAKANLQVRFFAAEFEVWLRQQFRENVGFDAMARAVLTVAVNGARPAIAAQSPGSKPTPVAYVAAKEGKPENLAAAASRLFLGVRLECAQCHNHPFATWKREEFWGLAAFFSGVERQGNGNAIFQGVDRPERHELTIPGTSKVIEATFLDGTRPDWSKGAKAREVLADWVTAAENPYFARAVVNRVWAQFFGVGLVDPVDDLGAGNEPSHPELLDRLAEQFAANRFDLKYLARAITASRAYQLTSAGGSPSQDTYRLFDRMRVRGLSPSQLYESLMQATGLRREPDPGPRVIINNSLRGEFLERFAAQEEKPTERQTTILQALTLLNGKLVDDGSSPARGMTLPAVADAPFLDTAGKLEALYLAALSRRPRADELERLAPYVDRGGPAGDPGKALGDVFWSLLGSAEFVLNH